MVVMTPVTGIGAVAVGIRRGGGHHLPRCGDAAHATTVCWRGLNLIRFGVVTVVAKSYSPAAMDAPVLATIPGSFPRVVRISGYFHGVAVHHSVGW